MVILVDEQSRTDEVPKSKDAVAGPGAGPSRVDVPKGLWTQCPSCQATLYQKALEENLFVCTECNYHHRVPARTRIQQLADPDTFEEFLSDLVSTDPLKFKDRIPYHDRLREAREKTLESEAIVVGKAFVRGRPVILAVMNPFFIMASTFHLIDSLWALMLANAAVGVPFATWLLKGFFDGIPRDLEHAAMIDGCGHLTAFLYIIVPLARPGLAACAIYLAILTWSDFVFAKTLINDQAHWTITTGMVSFIGEHGIDWSALMAAGVISMVPMVVLFLLLEPFLVSGMTSGSQR